MDNKERLNHWLKMTAMLIWAMTTIVSCAAAFNSKEGFVIVCGIIVFLVNGFLVYRRIGLLMSRKFGEKKWKELL